MSLMPMVPKGHCLFGHQPGVSHLQKLKSSSEELLSVIHHWKRKKRGLEIQSSRPSC